MAKFDPTLHPRDIAGEFEDSGAHTPRNHSKGAPKPKPAPKRAKPGKTKASRAAVVDPKVKEALDNESMQLEADDRSLDDMKAEARRTGHGDEIDPRGFLEETGMTQAEYEADLFKRHAELSKKLADLGHSVSYASEPMKKTPARKKKPAPRSKPAARRSPTRRKSPTSGKRSPGSPAKSR
jgi:hypothetical protein